ncbi:MAG: TetR family transcriptional regulator C-terminal domain-containing protein [Paracoccaceae bacterium]|nr:TetR family transcriptional regulator C-terminal domain-containing protein [Paracoccaceae bacterium]
MDEEDAKLPIKRQSRIQIRNRKIIMDAALIVFSENGYRGATLDQIAIKSGLSKPNILYYFEGKQNIHLALLSQLMAAWLAPLDAIDPDGEPLDELLCYMQRKLVMSREFPRESRLFANEILQGAPRITPHLQARLKPLFEEKTQVIQSWVDQEKLAPVNPRHLLFSIWATTQHYADFETQINILLPEDTSVGADAAILLHQIYERLLKV